MIDHTKKGIPEDPSTVSLEGIWNPGSTVKRPSVFGIKTETALGKEAEGTPVLEYML